MSGQLFLELTLLPAQIQSKAWSCSLIWQPSLRIWVWMTTALLFLGICRTQSCHQPGAVSVTIKDVGTFTGQHPNKEELCLVSTHGLLSERLLQQRQHKSLPAFHVLCDVSVLHRHNAKPGTQIKATAKESVRWRRLVPPPLTEPPLAPSGATALSSCSCGVALLELQHSRATQGSRSLPCRGRGLRSEPASLAGLRRKIQQVFVFLRQVLQLPAVTRYRVRHHTASSAWHAFNKKWPWLFCVTCTKFK